MMTEEFNLRLLSVDLSNNYLEAGEYLYISISWLNEGVKSADFDGDIAVDFVFKGEQRRPENISDCFRIRWKPFPEFCMLGEKETFETTGKWKIPETWCGTFNVNVSVIRDDGKVEQFIGKTGQKVFFETVASVDLGWGWGHKMLVAQRKPVHIDYFHPENFIEINNSESISIGCLTLNRLFPSSSILPLKPIISVFSEKQKRIVKCIEKNTLPIFLPAFVNEKIVIYRVKGFFGTADIVFKHEYGKVLLSVENISEKNGFRISSVYFPCMLVTGENGRLINYFGGGREVSVQKSFSESTIFNYYTCLAAASLENEMGIAVISDNMEANIRQSVCKINNKKYGITGCEIRLYLPAFSSNVSPIDVPNIPIEFIGIKGGTWQLFADTVRNRLPDGKMTHYDNAIIYKISADKTYEIDENRPITYSKPLCFENVKQIIEKIYNISGGIKQFVYLVGWQRRGHDTEYPCPHLYGFSKNVGSFEEWRECMLFAERHNAVLSFHDNFDDSYNLDDISDVVIAKNEFGINKTGWLWAGGLSNILSQKAYNLTGEMSRRVADTVKKYNIKRSYHLDVLSAEVRRYDYSPEYCSAANENLEYKKKIIYEFEKYGVDVTSEMLSYPFVGSIEYALHTNYDFKSFLFSSEHPILLTTYTYHGKIRYGRGSLDGKESRAEAVMCGSVCGMDCVGTDIGKNHIDSIYLHTMPMQLLADKKVIACYENNDSITVEYEDNCNTVVNKSNGCYSIKYKGFNIVENGNAIIPHNGNFNEVFVYSEEGSELSLNFFKSNLVSISELSFDKCTNYRLENVSNGILTIKLYPGKPVNIKEI